MEKTKKKLKSTVKRGRIAFSIADTIGYACFQISKVVVLGFAVGLVSAMYGDYCFEKSNKLKLKLRAEGNGNV